MCSNTIYTLTEFWLNCFIIMASKSGFFWKTWNCGYFHAKKHLFDGHTFKADIGQHFDKSEKIHQGGATISKQLKYFSNANNSTTLMDPGPPGVSKEAKLSTKLEFGSLVR